MHLGNGIICPVTGIPMLAAAGVAAYYAFKKSKVEFTKEKFMQMSMLTGLVFALQMINFSIPTTGSSGHIVGGILLAALLGPYVGFLAMAAILIVQAVFFADGGLLALGCNISNMGVLSCFVAYPLLYKPLEKKFPVLGAILASVAALQLGSIAVVIEGALSGSVPMNAVADFTLLMQAIHLPIGAVEGVVTAIIIAIAQNYGEKKSAFIFGLTSLILAGGISQYASSKPDGLEWSLLNISDSFIAQTQGHIYSIAELIQTKTAVLTHIASIPANIIGLMIVILLAAVFYAGSVMVKNEQEV